MAMSHLISLFKLSNQSLLLLRDDEDLAWFCFVPYWITLNGYFAYLTVSVTLALVASLPSSQDPFSVGFLE